MMKTITPNSILTTFRRLSLPALLLSAIAALLPHSYAEAQNLPSPEFGDMPPHRLICTCGDPDCICATLGCGEGCEPQLSEQQLYEIRESLPTDSLISAFYCKYPPLTFQPRIFRGYRTISQRNFTPEPFVFRMDPRISAWDRDRYAGILYSEPIDSLSLEDGDEILSIGDFNFPSDTIPVPRAALRPDPLMESIAIEEWSPLDPVPDWIRVGHRARTMLDDMMYIYMTSDPSAIDYSLNELPVPPTLPEDDSSFGAFLRSLPLPEVDRSKAVLPKFNTRHINWLHTVGGGIQFSQAYISSNWYQGGNNYLALLFNFNWDVVLNTHFHPNKMFESNLSYKLALNSNQSDALHKYSISQDLFQYNLKMGLKAFQKWFYSFNLQFKTQIFNSYPSDSLDLGAAFLSPGDFNMGLGMTYTLSSLHDTMKFSASISPISYNLKTCLSDRIDHLQFNIAADRHTASEIGSNAELTLTWAITSNISWKSRLFLFTNYKYFLADWENTFNFEINRFLSTQLYLHPRYDSSSDFNSSRWHYWSIKEILSFGLSYTFTTAP